MKTENKVLRKDNLEGEVKNLEEEKSGKDKEAEKMSRSQSSSGKRQQRRITNENKKVTVKRNETETGPRRSRGKKQRRQYKLAPNRG